MLLLALKKENDMENNSDNSLGTSDANGPQPPKPKSWGREEFPRYVPPIFVGLLTIIIIVALTGKETLLEPLAKVEIARGVITFLVAVATIAIAISLAISISLGGKESNGAGKHFTQAKEVLTMMVGILGTIVGFYFGLSPGTQAETLQVTPAVITDQEPAVNRKTTIIAFVRGGKAPYTYSITFDDNVLPAIKNIGSQDGTIKQDIVIPPNIPPETKVMFTIDVKDNEGRSVTYRDEARNLKVKALSKATRAVG
jgi:hypothetical protein